MKIDYSNYSLEELHSARGSIDREKFPENYEALVRQIEIKRAERASHPAPAMETEFRIAGAWSRLGAIFVDGLIIAPISMIFLWAISKSFVLALIAYPAMQALALAYHVYFHAKYGATPGKMALKIKVVRDDYSRINLQAALRRSLVDGVLQFFLIALSIGVFIGMADRFPFQGITEFSLTWQTGPLKLVQNLHSLWVFSEFITCLLNKRRKAIHDFIAGTIVVKEVVKTVPAP